METVILNGRVNATGRSTGQAIRACAVSVVAERKDFALDEPRLDPQQCLHRLGAIVSTSWFGKDSYDFAHRNGRLRLIDGRNLKALLSEHLNIDALVGLPKVPPG
ncbi:hypothetical protein [Streptomyces sp. 1114.5]|uniref:hypothetical protein n=1 Tax=Streptomyces sp. 1114.5 TaxID=1938830 RepID=UPI000EAD5DB7|nr:hypothetical protein [Streptomyces sp. 1114.5]